MIMFPVPVVEPIVLPFPALPIIVFVVFPFVYIPQKTGLVILPVALVDKLILEIVLFVIVFVPELPDTTCIPRK